ncbi:DUF262 domain-containing protein [Vibrio parahaemolyticus]
MKTELYSVSKIFTERLLRIPDYQRGYAWTNKQLKEYWSDINQLESGHNHYVGVLTLETVPIEKYQYWSDDLWIIESKCYEPHFIVDGQQRLTTTIILIQAILESIDVEILNYTSLDDIKKKYIFESKDGGISRSYLFGYVSDNPSYEFLKQKIFNEPSESCNPIQETIYTNNLKAAKDFFLEKLSDMDIEKIELIYRKITQNLLFNIYAMSEEIDVHVSFETMNNRGKPLSHLELLKNRLIYLSTKLDADNHEKSKLRTAINDCWKTIYHQLGRNKDNPLDDDVFLFNHFILFFGKDLGIATDYDLRYGGFSPNKYKDYLLDEKFTAKSVQSEGEDKIAIHDLYHYVSSMKNSVETWYEISNPTDSSLNKDVVFWLEKINRGKTSRYLPLIMVSLQKEKDTSKLVKFLKIIEKQMFLSMLANSGYYMEYDNSDFVLWASELSHGSTNLDKIITKLESSFEVFKKSPELLLRIGEHFKDGGFYRWRGLRYFMYEYEEMLRKESKSYTIKLNPDDFFVDRPIYDIDDRDHKTIEHVYPQNPRQKVWTERYKRYSAPQRTLLRHSLGNLVPLSQPKNSSFQNKPFLQKVGNQENTIGFKYGSFSEIELTKHNEWTPVEILNRGLQLLDFMEKRWGIKFGSIENKIKFLRLGFVIELENLEIGTKQVHKITL